MSKNQTPEERIIASNLDALGLVEKFVSDKNIHVLIDDEKKKELITSIHKAAKATSQLTNDPKIKEGIALKAARVESLLRGFDLPLEITKANIDQFNQRETKPKNSPLLDEKDASKISQGYKETIVGLAGKGYSDEKYQQAVGDLTSQKANGNIDKEKAYAIDLFVQNGYVIPDIASIPDNINEVDKAATLLTEIFADNRRGAEFAQIRNDVIESIEKNGNKLDSKAKETITQALIGVDKKLGHEYVIANKDQIKEDFSKEVQSVNKESLFTKIKQKLGILKTIDSKAIGDAMFTVANKHKEAAGNFTDHQELGGNKSTIPAGKDKKAIAQAKQIGEELHKKQDALAAKNHSSKNPLQKPGNRDSMIVD